MPLPDVPPQGIYGQNARLKLFPRWARHPVLIALILFVAWITWTHLH